MKKFLMAVIGMGLAITCQAKDFETPSVLLQALDKTTGRTSFLTVKVGEPYAFGDLEVIAEKCMKRPPEETPENSVFLKVHENEEEIFKGWMFSSNPALSSMEHPVYDIWIVECKSNNVASDTPLIAPIEDEEVDEVDTEELED